MSWYKIVEFCTIPFIGYFIMTQVTDFSSIQGEILTKCEMHPCVMVIYIWFKLYFLCIPTHEELQLQVFTDTYDIQNGIQKKVS